MDMDKLMRPTSVVVIGASDKPGMAGDATASSIRGLNKDRVYYLNPRRDEINGRKCYHALCELPEIPDCMLICTPAHVVPDYMEEAGKMGIRAAVVIASGFSEQRTEEARALSDKLKETCERYDMALCGPNCIGIINGIDNVCVTANNDETMTMLADDERRGIGVIAQSGYISSGFNNPNCDYLACVVSAGNSVICGLEDYMLYMVQEDRINCIAAYIEGITKPDVLIQALKIAAARKKPIVILKAGSSSKGGFAAASHTGSLTGNHRIILSILKKYGAIITESLEELVSTARMFAILDGKHPVHPSMAGINFSGGENTLCADTAERYDIALPDFATSTLETIQALVPPFATPANPLDATTALFSEKELVRKLFLAASGDSSIGLIAIGNDLGIHAEPKDLTCAEVLCEMQTEGILKPTLIIPSFEKTRNENLRQNLEHAGIPVLSTGEYAYRAIRHLMDFVSFDISAISSDPAIPALFPHEPLQKRTLSEKESKELMAKVGIPVPKQCLLTKESDLENACENIPSPWVLKVDSEDIPHKTEAGGVSLHNTTIEEAGEAYQKILTNCKKYNPKAQINGVLLQQQLPAGQEILLGITCDRMFGPMLLCGLGGIQAELFRDTALAPCPVSKKEALAMLRSLKIWPLLDGFRGIPKADTNALAELMCVVSQFAADHRNDLAELDLNPVFVYEEGHGAVAADALVVRYEAAATDTD